MRYDTAVSFVKKIDGYNPRTGSLNAGDIQSVVLMANVTEATAATQKAVIGEIRPHVLFIRTRERPCISFGFVTITGRQGKWKPLHEVRTLKGYSLMVGEQDG